MSKQIHCPYCDSTNTIRKGVRRGKLKYFCKSCSHWFQINRSTKKTNALVLTLQHLGGLSYRTLADSLGCSSSTVYRQVAPILSGLPHCADITRNYCNRFCGILLVDGKYVAIKGYERKIPVLYGIDYTSHDIPHYILSVGENYATCRSFFNSLRLFNYPLQAVVCDDNKNIFEAARYIYPKVAIQICQNHFKENIRAQLGVRTDPNYQPFMRSIETLFSQKRSQEDFDYRARRILVNHMNDPLCVKVMLEIEHRKDHLLGYLNQPGTPTTTNLIECFNSHLQGRLETIKGFENFQHADDWLNGYFLHRRNKKIH
jgi:hypothetical protein